LFYFIDKTPIENLHLSFYKYVLGIRKKASNLAVRIELGRLPAENFIKSQTLLYFIYFFGLILRAYYLLNFHSKILVLILHISWVVLLDLN
jgi:hypothetical protein